MDNFTQFCLVFVAILRRSFLGNLPLMRTRILSLIIILKFIKNYQNDDGVYYATFEKTDDLKNLLQINLSKLIADKFSIKKSHRKNISYY